MSFSVNWKLYFDEELMPTIDLVINHTVGLHARPASKFVQLASRFPCEIKVKNLTTDSRLVNGKSILSILTLGVVQGHTIRIVCAGEKSEQALKELTDLIQQNFNDL